MHNCADNSPKKKVAFRFHLQGKTLVLIDWANVFNWIRGEHIEIDPRSLYEYLRSYPQVDRVCLFAGEDDHPKSKEFLEECRRIGFDVITKKVKYVPTYIDKSPFWEALKEHVPEHKLKKLMEEPILRRKADFDVELSKELLLNLDQYHSYVLFSGDGDYATVIEEIMKREKRVFIVSAPKALGKELRNMLRRKVHPLFVDIFALKDVLSARRGAQQRMAGGKRRTTPSTQEKPTGFLGKLFGGLFGGKK